MAQSEVQEESEKKGLNFVEEEVFNDLKAGKNGGRLSTRFPPEPNGYLHIGHAKAICMDFGVAEKFGGTCNLRFDDTNPVKEDVEYVDSIREDIHWLGFDWGNREYYASDYFPQLFDLAVRLIKEGKAYVDDQTSEEIAAQKGTPGTPGQESPYRNRSVEENLDLFMRMNAGEFDEGARVLRAKIDMASPNTHFRDPIMYRQRACRRKLLPAPDRVQPPQPHIYCDEQAQTAAARQRRPCGRLGRPPYADHIGYAPPRIHSSVDPQLYRYHRLYQV